MFIGINYQLSIINYQLKKLMEVGEFIKEHRDLDVRNLALQADKFPDIDMKYALMQIEGWQTARNKLPLYADTDGIIFPPSISMQQCSSQFTAEYKKELADRICSDKISFIDITGGFGVDFSFIAQSFSKNVFVEIQPNLCEIAQNNFNILNIQNTKVVCMDGIEYLKQDTQHFSLIFADPARRDSYGRKMVAISDCQPDISEHLHFLLQHADNVIIKLSPMLDWHKAVGDLEKHVSEIHIVSVDNECKELLLVLCQEKTEKIDIYCINNNDKTIFYAGEETANDVNDVYLNNEGTKNIQDTYKCLYLPNTSLTKSGMFEQLAYKTNTKILAKNSHIILSKERIKDFPGRILEIENVCSMNGKQLKKYLSGIDNANIMVRNFPLKAEQLKKKLKMKDGGDKYIIGTTDRLNNHILFICNSNNF